MLNTGVLVIADRQVINPTHEQLITAGWTQEEDPVSTAEELLGETKRTRLYERYLGSRKRPDL